MASIKFFDSHIHIYPGSEGRCTKFLESGHVDGMNLILLSSAYKDAAKLNGEGFALKRKFGKMVQLAYWVNINEKGYMRVMEKAFKEHPEITGVKVHPPGDRKDPRGGESPDFPGRHADDRSSAEPLQARVCPGGHQVAGGRADSPAAPGTAPGAPGRR